MCFEKIKDKIWWEYEGDVVFVFIQGHAAPILYAAWAEAGFVPESELLNLRKLDSKLEGHPVPVGI